MALVSTRAEVTLYVYGEEANGDTVFVGWIPSPVPAYQVVNVIVQAVNPELAGENGFHIPELLGIATQAAPASPNGSLLFYGRDGIDTQFRYGVTIWYNE
jgi:hypothetical protein